MINALSQQLKKFLNERKLGVQEFSEMCDLPLETVRNIYYGKSADPKLSTILKMADALNMSINCLLGKCSHSLSERVLIENYRSCGSHGRSIIELVARYEAGAIKSERASTNKHKIPCILTHGDLRNGIVYDICETIEIETTIKDAYFAIRLTNNDLSPIYCKNDILLFVDRFPASGEIAAFFKGNRVYIRKFIEEDNAYILKCMHQYGEDVRLKRMDEVEYIGTITGVARE